MRYQRILTKGPRSNMSTSPTTKAGWPYATPSSTPTTPTPRANSVNCQFLDYRETRTVDSALHILFSSFYNGEVAGGFLLALWGHETEGSLVLSSSASERVELSRITSN